MNLRLGTMTDAIEPDATSARRRGVTTFARAAFALALLAWLPSLADWFNRVRERLAYGPPGRWGWWHALHDSGPMELLWHVWPLALALALLLTRRPQLLLGLALTILILAADGLGHLATRVVEVVESGSRPGLARPGWREGVGMVASLALAAVELAIVAWALRVRSAWRRAEPPSRGDSSRPPAIAGRLAVLGAIVFLILAGYGQLWTLYERFALRLPQVRTWLAGSVDRPRAALGSRLAPLNRKLQLALDEMNNALGSAARGEYAAARQSYLRALKAYEALEYDKAGGDGFRSQRALMLNNLAWMLATCPVEGFRDPEEAVALARRSIELVPEDGNTWNTLAVSLLRGGRLDEAEEGFERSMALRHGGDAFDWFFLAILDQSRGRRTEARGHFDRAAAWRIDHRPLDAELWRFHEEAARALGLDPPDPRENRPGGEDMPIPVQPGFRAPPLSVE